MTLGYLAHPRIIPSELGYGAVLFLHETHDQPTERETVSLLPDRKLTIALVQPSGSSGTGGDSDNRRGEVALEVHSA